MTKNHHLCGEQAHTHIHKPPPQQHEQPATRTTATPTTLMPERETERMGTMDWEQMEARTIGDEWKHERLGRMERETMTRERFSQFQEIGDDLHTNTPNHLYFNWFSQLPKAKHPSLIYF